MKRKLEFPLFYLVWVATVGELENKPGEIAKPFCISSIATRNEVTKDTVKHALVPLSVNCRGPLGPCATLVTSWFRKQVAYSPQACLASLSAASLYSSPVCAFTLRKESLNGKSFTASRYPRDSAVLARQLPLAQHSMPA